MQILWTPLETLRRPDWYLKRDLDSIALHKLMISIKSNSHGVLFVRRPTDRPAGEAPYYEVIDGVQRYRALSLMSAKEAVVEVVEASVQRCILMAWQRNAEWNKIDAMKLAQVIRSHFQGVYNPRQLAQRLPESDLELEALKTLLDFRWEDFTQASKGNAQQGSLF